MADEREEEFFPTVDRQPDSPGGYSGGPQEIPLYSLTESLHGPIRGYDGTHSLFIMAQTGDPHLNSCLQSLKEGNLLLNDGVYRSYDGSTPLWWAARNGHRESVEILLNGPPQHFAYGPSGVTPLMIASLYGHDEVVHVLCQRLPLNDVDLGGNTAVHYAAKYGEVVALQHLLGFGADFTVQNYCGETPEQLAREAGFDNCVATLQEFRMYFPVWAVVGMDDVADLERETLDKDILHYKTHETLLHWAARRPDLEMLCYLLDQGVPADRSDKWGNTPLAYAVARDNLPAVRLLLSVGSRHDDLDVVLKALALYGKDGDMHQLLLTHASRMEKEKEKALQRDFVMYTLRTTKPADYEAYSNTLKHSGYSHEEIVELLDEGTNMTAEELYKRAHPEPRRTEQEEYGSGSEEMHECIAPPMEEEEEGQKEEDEDLAHSLVRREEMKSRPDELETSGAPKEETEAEKKRRKKAKKQKLKEKQRSRQQGAEGKDKEASDEEKGGDKSTAQGLMSRPRSMLNALLWGLSGCCTQKDDEAMPGIAAVDKAKKKKKNKKKKTEVEVAEEADASADPERKLEATLAFFEQVLSTGNYAHLSPEDRRLLLEEILETHQFGEKDPSVGPPPANTVEQMAQWAVDEDDYRQYGGSAGLEGDEVPLTMEDYSDSDPEDLTQHHDFRDDNASMLRPLFDAQQLQREADEERARWQAELSKYNRQPSPPPPLVDGWYPSARTMESYAAGNYQPLNDEEDEDKVSPPRPPPYSRDASGHQYTQARFSGKSAWADTAKAAANKAREDAFLSKLKSNAGHIESLYKEHAQLKRQESGGQSEAPTVRLEIENYVTDDSDDLDVEDDIDVESDDGGTEGSGGSSSEEEQEPPPRTLGNNEAERLAEKKAEKNRKKKERKRKAKATMQHNTAAGRLAVRGQGGEEGVDSDDEPTALLGGGGGIFRNVRGFLSVWGNT